MHIIHVKALQPERPPFPSVLAGVGQMREQSLDIRGACALYYRGSDSTRQKVREGTL
jgi:hypothetical protein